MNYFAYKTRRAGGHALREAVRVQEQEPKLPVEKTIRHGELHEFPIESIKIGNRYRDGVGDPNKFSELVASIKRHGLWHPIVVDRSLTLVAGYCRLEAHKRLKITTIRVHFVDELNELQRREIELEENVHRQAMEWHEEDKLRAEIHRIKQAVYGVAKFGQGRVDISNATRPWSTADTATSLNVEKSTVKRALAMDHAMRVIPALTQADSRKEAERRVRQTIEDLERELRVRQIARQQAQSDTLNKLILGDICAELAKLPPSSVDCCIADPPYGVDIAANSGWRTAPDFKDDPVAALALLRAFLKELRRVLRPEGHFYLFFPTIYYYQILNMLVQAQFVPDEIPLIWVKDEHGTLDWKKRYAPSYEAIFFCSDGTRTLDHKRVNIFIFPTDKNKEHPYQKPVQLLRELLLESSRPGEIVLDPFGGSGSASIAAKQLSCHYIYIDDSDRSLKIAQATLATVQEGSHRKTSPAPIPTPKKEEVF